jgi:protoheme IX farnesyltransferase
MYIQLNPLTALLTLFGMLFYIIVYTIVLKPLTTENITIGGVAGMFPPLVGWTAVSGELDLPPLFLGVLVVLWTPPHFWSLALFHSDDYRRAGVPMLPVVRGEWETKRRIGVYTAALVMASYVLVLWEPLGPVYLVGVTVLDVPMLVLATLLLRTGTMDVARRLFAYSNVYLLSLFVLTMVDGAFL